MTFLNTAPGTGMPGGHDSKSLAFLTVVYGVVHVTLKTHLSGRVSVAGASIRMACELFSELEPTLAAKKGCTAPWRSKCTNVALISIVPLSMVEIRVSKRVSGSKSCETSTCSVQRC